MVTPTRGFHALWVRPGNAAGAQIPPSRNASPSKQPTRHTALDENDSECHRILAVICLLRKDLEMARYHQGRALALNPNDDRIVAQNGVLLTWLGRGEEGADWIESAMRLNPYHPERYWNHLGRAHFVARSYQRAIDAFKHRSVPNYTHHAFLAACYAQLESPAEAKVQAKNRVEFVSGIFGRYLSRHIDICD